MSQNKFDALVSFVYNIGETKLRGTRTLSMIVSNPNNPEIGAQLKKWVNAGGKKSNGLVIRRDREVKLYFTK